MSNSFKQAFSARADQLYAWLHPFLPEDPAFYREDGSVLFGSVTHEHDAFFFLTENEIAEAPRIFLSKLEMNPRADQ
jgi:hypothetical protein